MPRVAESLAVAFESRYVPEALTGCWLWHGAAKNKAPHEYGELRKKGAHRVSWELHCGSIPDGLNVCHRCDTPLCVNPGHLFLGTHRENSFDMVSKNRQARGEGFGGSVLTESAVRDILSSTDNHRVLAARHGVDYRTVSQVRNRQTWVHVEGERQDDWRDHLVHRGSAHKRAKLTEADIPDICARAAAGETHKSIAARLGVTRPLVSMVVRGEIWAHVPRC